MQTIQKPKQDLHSVMAQRRSVRVLGNREILPDDQLEALIGQALQLTPTAFHAQEQRLVLLRGARHAWFWDLVHQTLKSHVPPERFPETERKLDGFRAGTGTILLYQDTEIIKSLQAQMPTYRDKFPHFAQQASGMLKYSLWVSLVAAGYGVSLQHYTELIEHNVQHALSIDPAWSMVGQIPFGSPEETPSDKEFLPLDQLFLRFD